MTMKENEKQYLVSKRELTNLCHSYFNAEKCQGISLEDFLKSKKPVQKEQPKFATEQEIRGILKKFIGRHTTMYSSTAFEDAVSQLSKLSKNIDRDRVEGIIRRYGYDTKFNAYDATDAILSLAIPQLKMNEQSIREIVLSHSIVREFELKDGSKVGYRVIGIEEGEAMVTELSKLSISGRDRVESILIDNFYSSDDEFDFMPIIKKATNQICKTGGEDDN